MLPRSCAMMLIGNRKHVNDDDLHRCDNKDKCLPICIYGGRTQCLHGVHLNGVRRLLDAVLDGIYTLGRHIAHLDYIVFD